MAAVFPLDTTKPWTFNGVTYQYDATEDRWFVVSTIATDIIIEDITETRSQIDVLDTIIDQEIQNRSNLLDVVATKNNQQDASINELNARVDALAASTGKLEFKGRYTYVLEKTTEACTAAYAQCLLQAAGDVPAMSECNRLKDACDAAISNPYSAGSFTSKGTTNVIADIEEFLITAVDADGQTIDWLNTAEEGDYLEFFDSNDGDTALFEIVDEPATANTEQTIRVKFINQTGLGDGNFNLQQSYDIRVIKVAQGIDLIEADTRYVNIETLKLRNNIYYTDDAPTSSLKNGDLWIDSDDLQIKFYSGGAWINPDRQVGGNYIDQTTYASKIAELEARITALGG